MTSNSHPSINDRLLSPIEESLSIMHPSTDASPDIAANEPHLSYEAANKIVKKLSPDMVENIFKFISGEEVMRATDIARILSYLGCEEIMRARRVSKKWRDAAKMTVPTSEFVVDSVRSFNTMRVMTTALPNLQQLALHDLGDGDYCDGENLDEEWATLTDNDTTHDIDIISNFRRLQSLEICDAPLNGSFPVLFNFPLLQKINICHGEDVFLKWNLDMLSGLPSLKELRVNQEGSRGGLSGNVRSLRVLKDTLEKVDIFYFSDDITGNFMDLADFPRLKVLYLWGDIDVRGDVRDINEHDFPALENLRLPESVRGGMHYKFHSITEVPSFMHAIRRLLQRNPNLFKWDLSNTFRWSLSKQSPDWYDQENGSPQPPFELQYIRAGARTGWGWYSGHLWSSQDVDHSCEINWLDPEPSSESSDYEAYMEEMHGIQQHINFYKGYYEPPNEQQYRRLCEGVRQRD